MTRKGIYFQLKPGKRETYISAHQKIWPSMLEVLGTAGIRNYSIWNIDDKLFAYYEVDDETHMQQILNQSKVYAKWREYMEEFVYKEPKTDQKEWLMDQVFFFQGK